MKKRLISILNTFRVVGLLVYTLVYLSSIKYKKKVYGVAQASLLLLRQYLGTIYSFCIGLNLIFLVYYFVNVLHISQPNYKYFISVALYFNPNKKIELIEYLLGTIVLGLWFTISVFCEKFLSRRAYLYMSLSLQALTKKNYYLSILAIVVNLILPVIIFSIGHYNFTTLIIELLCLLIAITIPFWSYLLKFGHSDIFDFNQVCQIRPAFVNLDVESRRARFGFSILIISVMLFLVYIFYTPMVKNPQIINEYYNIPEQTILKNNHIVDNTHYWRTHFISPITFKGDVATKLSTQNCLYTSLESINILTPKLDDYGMYYDKSSKLFCINGNTPLSVFNVGSTVNLDQLIYKNNMVFKIDGTLNAYPEDLYNVLENNSKLSQQQELFSITPEENLFMDANQYEIRWQLASRFMIHHNSFMFIPISSLMLHESSAHVSAQYGLGNAKLFAYVYNKFGDISFDNWLRVSYGFYLVYFLMLILVSAVITGSYVWTAIILIMSLTIENLHGYDFLLLPPGDSPWRNLLDLLSLLMMFIYSRQKSFIFYVIALFLGLVSIILNPQIGLMILVATLLSGVFYAVYERLRIKLTLISSILTLVGALYLYVKSTGDDDLAQYYLDGVIGFPIGLIQLTEIFIAILISYLIIFKIIRKQETKNYIYLIFMVIYAQELLLYVVWHFNTDGFLARGYIYTLAIILLVFNIKSFIPDNIKKILCIVILGLYCYSVIFMLQSKYQYDKIFEQHVTYNWNLDRAHITSTMNPVYFENGVKLIDKYSKNKNGIYIISEYDNFLPFLAHKYSLMPFFDMKWYVVTPKELNKTIDLLKIQQPEYLFVDTNIDRNLNNEIIDVNLPVFGSLNEESSRRVFRLKLLNLVYQSVAANYTLVESSSLISVYKLKNKIR